MTITNSTLSGNSAGYDGGAIGGGGILAIESSTLSNNSASGFGGGIKVSGGMGYSLRNTIVANNTATVDGPDCYAMAITSGGYNLIGDKSGCMFTPTTGDLTGVDAKLGVLQDNGGPTLTHALSSGSLAIDHANPDGCKNAANNLLAADQRGMSRHGRCDIGAYEWQPAPFGTNTLFLPTIIRSCASAFYFDDFSNPASGWPSGESTNVLIEYLNNEYRILVKNPHVSVGASPGSVISDYIVVSDVRNVTGTYGAYGIMFDYVPDDLHLYVFGIDPASNYAIWRVVDGAWTPLASGFTDSIHSETASNQLKIERKGRQIWAYVNGELLNIIDEATLTGSRHLGLLARSYAETNVDIRFDNFTVYPITCGASSTLLSQGGGMAVNKVFDMGFPKSWQVQHSQSIIP
jgi:hypothetical protein